MRLLPHAAMCAALELAACASASPTPDKKPKTRVLAFSVSAGQPVPLDQRTTSVHAGKAPFTSREIELAPGKHTITVVMADAAHGVVAEPEPVSVTVLVEQRGKS